MPNSDTLEHLVLNFKLNLSRNKKWSEIQKIPLNLEKCSHMSIPPQDNLLYFSGQSIKKKSHQKDLGVLLSDDLNGTNTFKKAVIKARNVLWMVKKNSQILSPTAKLNIYEPMIVPILMYGSNVWYPNNICCKTLEKIQ